MLYTEKQVQRMIEERLYREMMEMHNSRRFEEIEERIDGLYKRVCECECRLEEIANRNGKAIAKCENP
jgi:hypothetical protein